MVIGFSVKCAKPVATQASRSGVDIYLQGVIYRLIEEVTSRVASLLPPIIETRTVGEGAVSQLFTVSSGKGGGKPITVAGCRVNNGAFAKADQMRVVRGGNEVHQGASLPHPAFPLFPVASSLTPSALKPRPFLPLSAGPISSLKYLKDDVSEVRKGSDCGLQLAGFDDLRPGDVLQVRARAARALSFSLSRASQRPSLADPHTPLPAPLARHSASSSLRRSDLYERFSPPLLSLVPPFSQPAVQAASRPLSSPRRPLPAASRRGRALSGATRGKANGRGGKRA